MKLDRFKFASLVNYIIGLRPEHELDLYKLDTLTEINGLAEPVNTVPVEKVDYLLQNINRDNGLIEAIKAYRILTGAGLKEAKDAIEKYRNVKVKVVGE